MPTSFPAELQAWFGNIHNVVSSPVAGIVMTFAAVICGGLIGTERQRAGKPAGMRTLILICLGSCIFSQGSFFYGAHADASRVAAQVVSGIGFLGAGTIIQARGHVIGITTAASIWAAAAVGLVIGSGHIAAGVVFTIMILLTLVGVRGLDKWIDGRCRFAELKLTFDADHGKTRYTIQSLLDQYQHDSDGIFEIAPDGSGSVRVRFCEAHREHRNVVGALIALPEIKTVQQIESR